MAYSGTPCEATTFVAEMYHFKRGDLLSGGDINTFMFSMAVGTGGGAIAPSSIFCQPQKFKSLQ